MNNPQNSEVQSSSASWRSGGGQAIILAGGLGTRLRLVVPDMPKCMAPVAGRPFIHYVIEHLRKQGVEKFIFSVGYKSDMIIEYINHQYLPSGNLDTTLQVQYSVEEEPLGTGGAIKLACSLASEKNVLVVNGDTLFSLDVNKLRVFHQICGADCTLSLKAMQNFDRYGLVEMNKDYTIASFKEKQHYQSGFINAGVYALNAAKFIREDLPEKFSFEKDWLEKYFDKRRFYGVVQDSYFIDIGIPDDYERAQREVGV